MSGTQILSEQVSWLYQSTGASEEGSRFESDNLVEHQKLGGNIKWSGISSLLREVIRLEKSLYRGSGATDLKGMSIYH